MPNPALPKTAAMRARIEGMLHVLDAVGIPLSELTPRRQEKMAMALLAVAGIGPKDGWTAAQGVNERRRMGTKDIIEFRNTHYAEQTSRGSYDDVKRKDLLYAEAANLVLVSDAQFRPAATNSPSRKYSLEDGFTALLRTYETPVWAETLAAFRANAPALAEALNKARGLTTVAVTLPDGKPLTLGFGEHNELQKAIIEQFLPRYGPGCQVLYVGDASDKFLHRLDDALHALGIQDLEHEELPDVVAYDPVKNWLYVIEAVHSFGAIDAMRHRELERLTRHCTAGIVYVTAFLNRKTFRQWVEKIDWETEVWIADAPEHLIHFNGCRFLGPYPGPLAAS